MKASVIKRLTDGAGSCQHKNRIARFEHGLIHLECHDCGAAYTLTEAQYEAYKEMKSVKVKS